MVELRVRLPDWAGDFLQQQVAAGIFDSPSECLVSLLEKARRLKPAQDQLAALVVEGEESGEGVEYSEGEWPVRRDRIIAELKKKTA
jgi:Arc/MetJ-type ribon-helix-helix transcriptional regulator